MPHSISAGSIAPARNPAGNGRQTDSDESQKQHIHGGQGENAREPPRREPVGETDQRRQEVGQEQGRDEDEQRTPYEIDHGDGSGDQKDSPGGTGGAHVEAEHARIVAQDRAAGEPPQLGPS